MRKGKAGEWPEGLSDEEAVQRLQTLCLGACDGIQDLADDARYKALRKSLLARGDLRPYAPAFVAAQPNLQAFVRHVRETKDRDRRREMVRSEFNLLWDHLPGGDHIPASGWTGRPSTEQQAAIVQALAPAAMDALQLLIDDEERRRGNGGPVETDREEALAHLKALHSALGELIRLTRLEAPLGPALSRIETICQGAKVAAGKLAAAVPVTSSVMLAFGTVAGIADFFAGNLVISVAAGTLAGTTVKDAYLKKSG